MGVSQYALPWPPFGDLHPENAAGSATLIEAEETNGASHRFLFDTGWNPEWIILLLHGVLPLNAVIYAGTCAPY
jgi:hypothetical protein